MKKDNTLSAKKVEKSIELGGRTLTLQTGVLAEQASGAVLARYGDTVVLATVVAAPLKQDLGYFPLTVDYQERLYAGGRIKGSRWVKREGRPTDDEILSARLIDRSIRPLFPKDYKGKDVQVIVMVLSVDIENDPSVLGSVAASAALAISSIPWKGPVYTLRVGMKDKKYFVNPLDSEMTFSDFDLVVSGTEKAVLMIEAASKEVSEEEILGGIEFATKESGKVLNLINDLVKESGQEKEVIPATKKNLDLDKKVRDVSKDRVLELIEKSARNTEGFSAFDELKRTVSLEFKDEDPATVFGIVEDIFKHEVRNMILSGKRPDGRKHDEIRPLAMEVGVLPRTHGSAIFQRGVTQVLTVTTLGAPSLSQLIETAEGEESKRYIHHYSMPPYASGETGRMGSPNRREIGHGALAEKAIVPVIPTNEVFPYTIRVVSEVTSSNGSTSMASVCGSTLSLMDAGVPITSPVSGIAMGLVFEGKDVAILSDIAGIEDFNGDMDFKVAGTKKGITALQLDVKTLDLTPELLGKALTQAKEGRAFILKTMLETLPESRGAVSSYAPKVKLVKIAVEKIGEVIGPGGKMIKKIIADTGAQVEVEDDGSVNISGSDIDAVNKAVAIVEGLVKEVNPGEIYEGTVKRILPFGAFVEILPGKEGLVHVSDMSEGFVKDPNDVVKLEDKVQVRVKEIDEQKRLNLSMNLDPSKDKPRSERPMGAGRSFGRDRGGFGGRSSFGGRRPAYGERRGPSSSGPHFPTSRFVKDRKDFSR